LRKIIDISQPLYDRCPHNPAFPQPRIHIALTHERDGWRDERFDYFNHTGTHIDAPYHRFPDGKKIDEISLYDFTGTAIPIDLYHKKEDEAIITADFQRFEKKIEEKAILLFCTGWGFKRSDSEEYRHHSPFLSPEAARWCVEKGVKGVGIDHFSIGGTNGRTVVETHEILLKNNIWIAEDLLLPREVLDREKWLFFGFPVYLKDGTGAPARIVLIDEE
jgi:kynurenine formamidase